MNPWLLMGISAGLQALSGASQAAQKKKQMLSAAEQTRYAPWTGHSGDDAFNQAAQQDPFGNTIKDLAGTVGAGASQMAANDKYSQMIAALQDAKAGPQAQAIKGMSMGGGQMVDSQSNPWEQMSQAYA